jgi:hypothetical protein
MRKNFNHEGHEEAQRQLLPLMKGEMKEGVGALPMFPTTPFTPSFIRRGNQENPFRDLRVLRG